MIHHCSLGTNDLKRARAFYDPIMEMIGLRFIRESDRIIAYGLTEVVFSLEKPMNGDRAGPGNGTHVAFHAGHRNVVDACYASGVENGGEDEGKPGIRADYDPHYYAAFLRDPDGNKIEIVTFSAN